MDKILSVDQLVGQVSRTTNDTNWKSFINNMNFNNTYCPNIKRVIFNLKTTDTKPVVGQDGKPVTDDKGRVKREIVEIKPVLATCVYFADGTKVTVVNSNLDAVNIERKEITYSVVDDSGKKTEVKTGKFAVVASNASKEAGIVYAIAKRLLGAVDDDRRSRTYNQVKGNGFGRKLHEIVDMAYDTEYEAVYNDYKKELAQKQHKEREAAAKEARAKRRPTVEQNIATLVEQNKLLLEKLAAK